MLTLSVKLKIFKQILMIFFQEEVLDFVNAQILFFYGFIWFLFKLSSFSLLKEKQTPLSKRKIVKVTKNRILVSKLEFIFNFLSKMNIL